jgi:hypothetical protein
MFEGCRFNIRHAISRLDALSITARRLPSASFLRKLFGYSRVVDKTGDLHANITKACTSNSEFHSILILQLFCSFAIFIMKKVCTKFYRQAATTKQEESAEHNQHAIILIMLFLFVAFNNDAAFASTSNFNGF